VGRRQAEAPRGRRAAAGELDEHPDERQHVELVAAVPPRNIDPVEAGLLERLVQLRRVVGAFLGVGLQLDHPGTELPGAPDQVVGGQVGFWRSGVHVVRDGHE
jgi:hypothetical protein